MTFRLNISRWVPGPPFSDRDATLELHFLLKYWVVCVLNLTTYIKYLKKTMTHCSLAWGHKESERKSVVIFELSIPSFFVSKGCTVLVRKLGDTPVCIAFQPQPRLALRHTLATPLFKWWMRHLRHEIVCSLQVNLNETRKALQLTVCFTIFRWNQLLLCSSFINGCTPFTICSLPYWESHLH